MMPSKKIGEHVAGCIERLLARCGAHQGNIDEFELVCSSPGYAAAPLLPTYIRHNGEMIGEFQYGFTGPGMRTLRFVGQEYNAKTAEQLMKEQPFHIYFLDGHKAGEVWTWPFVEHPWNPGPPRQINTAPASDICHGWSKAPAPADETIELITYYLMFEPTPPHHPQEMGGRFVYSTQPNQCIAE